MTRKKAKQILQRARLQIDRLPTGSVVRVRLTIGKQHVVDVQRREQHWTGRALPRMTGADCVQLAGALAHLMGAGWAVSIGAGPGPQIAFQMISPDAEPVVVCQNVEWRHVGAVIKEVLYGLAIRRGLSASLAPADQPPEIDAQREWVLDQVDALADTSNKGPDAWREAYGILEVMWGAS